MRVSVSFCPPQSLRSLLLAYTSFAGGLLPALTLLFDVPQPTQAVTTSCCRYCYRQAELGIGDCGGLRYIPGMTKSGKQKTPKWLSDALGVEQPPATEGQGKTLADLLGNDASE